MQKYPIWTLRHTRDSDSSADGSAEPLVDLVLANRSLTADDIADSPGNLQDPFSMKDMDRLTERIVKAVRSGERIVVFGDYDVDGVTSTAVLMDFLDRVGADVVSILPDRYRDGYGMKPPGVQRAIDAGAGLIVTADNGISSFEAVEAANAAGIDVLVTDHHEPQGRLPDALAVVNPNRPDCGYAFKGLAAVGVAFKAVQALSDTLVEASERRAYLNSLLDLVALGTVADVAPMLGENRLLTRRGLQILDRTQRPGLQALKAVAGADTRPVDTTAIGYFLGPRINSAGRLASADLALDLLRTSEANEAARLAERLNALNRQRRQLELAGVKQAVEQVESMGLDAHRILVAKGESWHLGVVGLIAGRLAEQYRRPGIACTEVRGDGSFTGSARSAAGYNIAEAIFRCADLLTEYGGHADAAGFTGPLGHYEAFRTRLEADAAERISDEDLRTRLELDATLRPMEISLETVSALSALSPFGPGNEAPLFMVQDCTIERAIAVGKGAHLKMNLDTGSSTARAGGSARSSPRLCDAVWWRQGELAGRLRRGDRVDVACALEANTWNGRTQVQLVLEDMRPAEE